jgi:CRP/FNR family cyclic AMP-dependent transcriptional regulator
MARAAGTARPFFVGLSPADREALLAAGRRRAWGHGERLVRSGDPADSAILILSGLVKVHRRDGEGGDAVLSICGPGDLLGELVAVRACARSADVTALEAVEGLVVGVGALRSLLAARPAITLALLELALARLRAADARRLEFATAGSLGRVTSRLLELTERFGADAGEQRIEVALPINQAELASWSASSRESTARALRTLRELGLIETRRRELVVCDLKRLRAHAPRL